MKRYSYVVAICLMFTGCAQPNGAPPGTGYSIFYSQADHMQALLDKQSFVEAIKLYADQETYFNEHQAKVEPLLNKVAAAYNARWQPRIDEALAACSAVSWPSPREKWSQIKGVISNCRQVLGDYGTSKLFSGSRRAEAVGALQQITDDLTRKIQADAARNLAVEDLESGKNFYSDYPVQVSDTAPLVSRLKSTFDPKSDESRLFKIASAYSAQVGDYNVKQELQREVGEVMALKAKTLPLQQIIRIYETAKNIYIAPRSIPVSVAIYTPPLTGTPFPVTIEQDLPFDWKTTSSLQSIPDADFVLVVGPAHVNLNRKVGDYEKISSKFLAGYQNVQNPNYQVAAANMQRAQQLMANARAQQIAASNDITCDMNGCRPNPWSQAAASIGMIAATSAYNDAQKQLMSTPQTIQQAVYQPYTFETASINSSKDIEFVARIGKGKLVLTAVSKSLLLSQNYKIAYHVHDKDTGSGNSSIYSTESTVDAWEKSPVSMKITDLIKTGTSKDADKSEGWAQVATSFDRIAFTSNLTPSQSHEVSKTAGQMDPRFNSVVVIKTSNALGSGFYVTANVILTNAHVVEGQTFVKMQTYDGNSINGKVIASDKRRDLALVQTQNAGVPVSISGKEISVGQPVEVVGHPEGLQFSLTRGIVSQVRAMPPASGVGGGLVAYVQLDASISPGNSGGPVFQNGSVIGVSAWKYIMKGAENLNFAIHRDEVNSFLRENGVQI